MLVVQHSCRPHFRFVEFDWRDIIRQENANFVDRRELIRDQEAGGSNPLSPTEFTNGSSLVIGEQPFFVCSLGFATETENVPSRFNWDTPKWGIEA